MGHESFLLSLISGGLDSEDGMNSEVVSMADRSVWLGPRLDNDEEVPGDLEALSASSFLKASSSRSNFRPKTSM